LNLSFIHFDYSIVAATILKYFHWHQAKHTDPNRYFGELEDNLNFTAVASSNATIIVKAAIGQQRLLNYFHGCLILL
jgi:hypothetical protein